MKLQLRNVKFVILDGQKPGQDKPLECLCFQRSGARQCLGGAVSGAHIFNYGDIPSFRKRVFGSIGSGKRTQTPKNHAHQPIMTLVSNDTVAL